MCTKICLCNSCYKRKTCSDCPYIDAQDISNNPWSLICSSTGIQSCDYYIKPPEINRAEINRVVEEDNSTKIKFKNGSTIEIVESSNTLRSKPKEFYYEDISEYIDYMKRYPYKFVELCTGIKPHLWQRLYLRFLDSDFVRKTYRYRRR